MRMPPVLLAQNGNLVQMLPAMVLIGIMFYFLLLRPERRKQQEHKALLESLKKDDRVVTIGGIYGTVANVRRDADRVTLKIDDSTNTKIDVTFASISRVITGDQAGDKTL